MIQLSLSFELEITDTGIQERIEIQGEDDLSKSHTKFTGIIKAIALPHGGTLAKDKADTKDRTRPLQGLSLSVDPSLYQHLHGEMFLLWKCVKTFLS